MDRSHSRQLCSVVLHDPAWFPSLCDVSLPPLAKSRWARLRGIPQSPAKSVWNVSQQLLRRFTSGSFTEQSCRVWDQTWVWTAVLQHCCAADEGEGTCSQHILDHVNSELILIVLIWRVFTYNCTASYFHEFVFYKKKYRNNKEISHNYRPFKNSAKVSCHFKNNLIKKPLD